MHHSDLQLGDSDNNNAEVMRSIGGRKMNDAAIARALKDISAELRRIRKELQRIAPIRNEVPDLETYMERLEDDRK